MPTTWDEYAETARALHAADPDQVPRHLLRRTTPAGSPGSRSRPAPSGGAIDGDAWCVGIDEEPTQKVADYWGGLVAGGRDRQQADVHPRVERRPQRRHAGRLARRRLGPGRARAATPPTPRACGRPRRCRSWDADASQRQLGRLVDRRSPRSRSTSTRRSKFATWLNTDPDAVQGARRPRPASTRPSTDAAASALTEAPEFFSNQPDFYDVAAEAAQVGRAVHLRPERQRRVQRLQRRVREGRRVEDRQAFLDAVAAMQQITVDDLKSSGFTVAEELECRGGAAPRRPLAPVPPAPGRTDT